MRSQTAGAAMALTESGLVDPEDAIDADYPMNRDYLLAAE